MGSLAQAEGIVQTSFLQSTRMKLKDVSESFEFQNHSWPSLDTKDKDYAAWQETNFVSPQSIFFLETVCQIRAVEINGDCETDRKHF